VKPAKALSLPQRAMLDELRHRVIRNLKPEWFAPNLAVAHALARKGLVTMGLIGQRWWTIQLTSAGRSECNLPSRREGCGSPGPFGGPMAGAYRP
jgi:hypothetical protein